MKAFPFICLFVTIAVVPNYCNAQWSFSVTGNLQFSREKITIDQSVIAMPPYAVRSKYILLPDAGVCVDYRLPGIFLLRSGMAVVGRGGNYTYPENITSFYRSYIYLDIPLFVIINPYLFNSNHFYVGCGPFIGYGLGGWYRNEDVHSHRILAKGTIKFREKNSDYLKDFDNGINFLLEYRFCKQFSIHFIYQYGLMDIYNGPDISYNRSIGIGIGYMIR